MNVPLLAASIASGFLESSKCIVLAQVQMGDAPSQGARLVTMHDNSTGGIQNTLLQTRPSTA